MTEEYVLDLYKSLRETQEKYIYFILAANGSAIGFTVQLIVSKNVSQYLWVLFIAVLCWGVSFYLGCKYLLTTMMALSHNIKATKSNDANFHQSYPNVMDKISSKGIKQFNWMFRFLIVGVVIFIGWFFVFLLPHIKS